MRDSCIFYRSFYEALKDLPPETRAQLYDAIFEYSLNMKELELSGIAATVFKLIKPQLYANIKRFENGKKPKTKQTESKTEANDKQNGSKTEANNNNNHNENENLNHNENANDKGSTIDFYQKDFFVNQNVKPICMQFGISTEQYYELKKTFYALQIESGKKYLAFNELKSHWANWLSIQAKELKKAKSTAQKGTNGLPIGMIHHQTPDIKY